MLPFRHLLVIFTSGFFYLLITWVFTDYIQGSHPFHERSTNIGFLMVSVFAIISNFRIIHYHSTNPPHPKFMMMPERKFWIRVHAISGSLEVVLGIIAWVTLNKDLAIATGILAVFAHVPSAYFQSPGVFGTKGIMVPAYFAIITIHFYCGVRLLQEGGDIVWLERTWMALQAYAYTRIFGFLLNNSNVFKSSIYTASVLFAGAAVSPFILGPIGPLLILLAILIYLGLYKLIVKPNAEEWLGLFQERERRSLIDENLRNLWIAKHVSNAGSGGSIENARLVFNYLDKNNSGTLSLDEVKDLTESWGASGNFLQSFFNHNEQKSGIDFHIFLTSVWISGRIQEQLTVASVENFSEPEARAQFVFNQLDLDGSGLIEPVEIELLLLEWGLDLNESHRYLSRFANSEQNIDFNVFYSEMKPIWSFAFNEIYA